MRQDQDGFGKDEKKERFSGAVRIFEALSAVDSELLERSEKPKKVIPVYRYTKGLAVACCFLVIGGAALLMGKVILTPAGSSMSQDVESMREMTAGAGDTAAEDAVESVMDEVASVTQTDGKEEEAGEQDNAGLDSGEKVVEAAESLQGTRTESVKESAGNIDCNAGNIDHNTDTTDYCDTDDIHFTFSGIEEARAMDTVGDYIPSRIPEGYLYESAYGLKDYGMTDKSWNTVSILWSKGSDTIELVITEYPEEAAQSMPLADISRPETYDVNRYEIPYADTVPGEYAEIFEDPVFAESDFSLEIVKARMKPVEASEDTDIPRGNFSVLYDSGVLVRFSGCGDAVSIWEMFQSIGK